MNCTCLTPMPAIARPGCIQCGLPIAPHQSPGERIATLQAELAAVRAERDGLKARLATVLLEREGWAREANAESARLQARIDAGLAECDALIEAGRCNPFNNPARMEDASRIRRALKGEP